MTLPRLALATAALCLPASAHAFCGTYVGQPGEVFYSGASQVFLARDGGRTVLTLRNDVEGDVADFAMVIPVPEVLDEDDVNVLDRAILERVRDYAGPRLVAYACSDFLYDGASATTNACACSTRSYQVDASGGGIPQGDVLDVTVEAEFAAGEYDIVILSSEDSADLLTWLDREGYGVSPEAEALLAKYIAADARFLAAKVRLEDVPVAPGPDGRPFLTPLQLTYESESFSLPIRLGTVNSPGSQDLLLYTLTHLIEGEVAIANYPFVELENDCLFEPEANGALEDYLDRMMDDAVAANGGAAWARTYSWAPGLCDPCPPGGALPDEVVRALGFREGVSQAHLTRLWMRYEADAIDADLSLYGRGSTDTFQLRYIERKPGLEQWFPVCEQGWVEDFPACEDVDDATEQSSPAAWWMSLGLTALLAGAGALLRRRA